MEVARAISGRNLEIYDGSSFTNSGRDVREALENSMKRRKKVCLTCVIGGRFCEGIDLGLMDSVAIIGLPFPPPSLLEDLRVELFVNELGISYKAAKI